jgi:hypothetical protein
VSMIVMGTSWGNKLSGSLVGGNTGGTFVMKFLAAAVAIRLDFPVPRSPATTIRTPVLVYRFVAPAEAFAIEDAAKQNPKNPNCKTSRKCDDRNVNISVFKGENQIQ